MNSNQHPIKVATCIPSPRHPAKGSTKYPFATLPVSKDGHCPYFEAIGTHSLAPNLIKFAKKSMPKAVFVYRLLQKGPEPLEGQRRKDVYGIWRVK